MFRRSRVAYCDQESYALPYELSVLPISPCEIAFSSGELKCTCLVDIDGVLFGLDKNEVRVMLSVSFI